MTTIQKFLPTLTLLAALGSCLIAGAFFAFSSFVMKALGRIAPAEGIAAMQSINIVVINPVFLSVFMGTAAVSLLMIVFSWLRWDQPGAAYLLAGGLLYLIGTFLVTMVFNVPRNNALAAIVPTSPEGARLWADYLVSWTFWNHVRTVAALAAAAAFSFALRY